MITYINKDNGNKYSILFENATQDLIAAGVLESNGKDETTGKPTTEHPINSLQEYFGYLPDLVSLEADTASTDYEVLHSLGRRYTILPLDEEVFEIDANTREITVPTSFKTNGLAVQGDELCEIVYFKVDRFYDATDLDTTNMCIQWTTPSGENGMSIPWVIDIESEPGKIIIGWAISSSVTEKAGTLKFAVRFYNFDKDNKIVYSLSTMTQTIQIKAGLDFEIGSGEYTQEEGINTTITDRIKGSHSRITDYEDAAEPIYILNLPTIADLVDGKLDLRVQAYSTDAGTVTYEWHDATHTLGASDDVSITVVAEQVPADEVFDSNKIYYHAAGTNAYDRVDTSATDFDYADDVSKGLLYEKVAICTVRSVGSFYVNAINHKSGTNSKTKKSAVCLIPVPSAPVFTADLSKAVNDLPESGNKTLQVVATNEETNGSGKGVLTYIWSKIAGGKKLDVINDEDFVKITTDTDHETSLSVSEEGYYKVKVVNSKNKEEASIESTVCRVTKPAGEPVLKYPTADCQVSDPEAVRIDLSDAFLADESLSDTCTYQWYSVTTGEDGAPNTEDDVVTELEGATLPMYTPIVTLGKFYCVVTNHKNGSEKSITSPKITYARI